MWSALEIFPDCVIVVSLCLIEGDKNVSGEKKQLHEERFC